jgi:hypothetical protein
MAAAFAIAGAAMYARHSSGSGHLSLVGVGLACAVGALSALVGCAVGMLIDGARK